MALLSFVVLSLIQFASGDRGFVYQVCILIFWYMQRKKIKIPKTKLIFFLIISYIGIGLLSAVKEIRGGHVTLSALVTVLGSAEKLPISSALLEMGGSMSPLVAIVAYGGNPYPYGNTFIFTLPGMITEHLITIFEIPYESLANWFSFEFLNLNYKNFFQSEYVISQIAEGLTDINHDPSSKSTTKTYFSVGVAYKLMEM